MPELLVLKGARISWHGRELTDQCRRIVAKRLRAAAQQVKLRCQQLISQKGGPSLPGQPPHLVTGQLRDSLLVTVDDNKLQATVGSTVPYAVYLEYGTMTDKILHAAPGHAFSWIDGQTGQRIFAKTIHLKPMAARPFLRPALDESYQAVQQAVLASPWL